MILGASVIKVSEIMAQVLHDKCEDKLNQFMKLGGVAGKIDRQSGRTALQLTHYDPKDNFKSARQVYRTPRHMIHVYMPRESRHHCSSKHATVL